MWVSTLVISVNLFALIISLHQKSAPLVYGSIGAAVKYSLTLVLICVDISSHIPMYLMNSPFVHTQANGFAKRLLSLDSDKNTRLRHAFEAAHGHVPSNTELASSGEFVAHYREALANDTDDKESEFAAWSALARVLLTSNSFLYVD